LNKLTNFIVDFNEKEVRTIQEFEKLATEMLKNNELQSAKELEDSIRIGELLDEVSKTKFKVRELESSSAIPQLVKAKEALVKTEAELLHAKKNLVNYIHSLNSLEDKMKDKLESSRAKLDGIILCLMFRK
jgi:hypothetical protein